MIPTTTPLRTSRPGTTTSRLAVAVAALLAAAGPAAAQSYTWTQPSAGTAANWSAGPWAPGAPTSGTTTVLRFNVFSGRGAYTFTDDLGAFTLNGLIVNDWGANLLTLPLGTNALTFDGTTPFLTSNGPGGATISGGAAAGGLVLNANTVFNGGGNGTLTVSSVIAGPGGLTVNQTGLGVVSLTGVNTFTGGVTLNGGNLSLGSAAGLGAGANVLTVNGGGLRFTAPATIPNNVTANANLVVAGGTSTPTLTGVIGGAGGLTLQNYNTTAGLALQGANTYSGATALNPYLPNTTQSGPTLTLSGPTGTLAGTSSITVGKNALLTLTNTAAANNNNRVPDAAPVAFNNGRFSFAGVDGTSETLGAVTLTGYTQFQGNPSGLPQVNFGPLTRVDNATLSLSTRLWGALTDSPATAVVAKFAGGLPTLAAGSGTGQEIGIVPFVSAGDANWPWYFATYDAANGLQAMPTSLNGNNTANDSPYYAHAGTSAGLLAAGNKNVNLTTAGTYDLGGGSLTVNSLAMSVSGITLRNGTLTVYSGAVANWDAVLYDTGATLDFGPRTGYLYDSWHMTFRDTAKVTGSNGLVISGLIGNTSTYAVSFDNPGGNPFTGGLFVNGNAYVGFRQDNQLGAAGGNITLSGGMLVYNAAADLTVGRAIKINDGNGGVSFNVAATNGTAGTATAATVLTLSGAITGTGAFIKEGVGVVNLTGNNTYAGGTVVSLGTLQFTTEANLGLASTRIVLNGGTLQPLAAGPFNRPVEVNASSTVLADVNATLAGPLSTVGQLHGTANPTLTKAGTGTLTLTANSPNLSAALAVTAGGVDLQGAIPQVGTITVASSTTFLVNNAGGYLSDRVGDFSTLTLSGGFAGYVPPATATAGTAEQFGLLTVTAANSVFNVAGSAASPTVLRFAALNLSGGNLTLRGESLGGSSGNYTRIYFDTPPAPSGTVIPNVFFANTSGTGTSSLAAQWDATLGVIQFVSVPTSGTVINNFSPDNVPLTAVYTTTGNAVAKTGVWIFALTLDGGSTLTLDGGNAASSTNANTPDGTLTVSGGQLTSRNGAKSVVVGSAPSPTIAFGATAATVTTASDLTLAAGITLSGTNGLTKAGAGTLAVNGTYAVTGPLTVTAGTLSVPNGGTLGATAVASGATLSTTAALTTGDLSGSGTVALGGTGSLVVNQAGTTTYSGAVSGGTTLTKTGAGTLTLTPSAAMTYAGGTTVANGTLVLGNANAANAVLPNLTLGGATGNTSGTIDLNGFSPAATVTGVNVAGTGTGQRIINGNTSAVSTINLNLPGDTTFPGAIGGNLVLNKNDAFALTLSGTVSPPATTTGVVNVNAGTLALTNGTSLSSGVAVNVASGATFRLNGASTSNAGAPFGTVTLSNASLLDNGTSYYDPYLNKLVFTNGGTVSVTAAGAGSWMHFAGAGAGITTLASSNPAVYNSTNANDQIQNDTASSLPITVAKGTVPGGVDLEINVKFTSGSTSSLTKLGPGTLQVGGNVSASTYAFVVNQGTLLAAGTGTGTGAITVNSGGTLAGAGTATGVVTVNAGGAVRGGTTGDTGTLNLGNNVTVANNGILRAEVAGSTGTSGLVNLTGASSALNLAPAAGDKFVINLVSNSIDPLVYGQAYTINLATVASGTINVNGSPASGTIDPSTYTVQSPSFSAFNNVTLSASAGVLTLSFTPVPEPATAIAVAAAGLGLGGLVRRRRAARSACPSSTAGPSSNRGPSPAENSCRRPAPRDKLTLRGEAGARPARRLAPGTPDDSLTRYLE